MMNNEYSVQGFAQSALTAIFLAFFKALLEEIQFWTGRFSDFTAFIWNDLLLAVYLSIDVIQFAVVESIGLIIRGDHLRTLVDTFKSAFFVILFIFQGAFQAVKSFLKYGDPFVDNRGEVSDHDEVDKIQSDSDDENQLPEDDHLDDEDPAKDLDSDLDISLSLD